MDESYKLIYCLKSKEGVSFIPFKEHLGDTFPRGKDIKANLKKFLLTNEHLSQEFYGAKTKSSFRGFNNNLRVYGKTKSLDFKVRTFIEDAGVNNGKTEFGEVKFRIEIISHIEAVITEIKKNFAAFISEYGFGIVSKNKNNLLVIAKENDVTDRTKRFGLFELCECAEGKND